MDQTKSKEIMAQAVMEAYEDLFNVNTEAQSLTEDEVKNKLRTLTQGKHSDNVLGLMAKTFKALAAYSAWGSKKNLKKPEQPQQKIEERQTPPANPKPDNSSASAVNRLSDLGLHYNIQIHLPETRDAAVYDAIFQSLKTHLL